MSIFFMLSGYLLAYRYADAGYTFRQYFVKRIARIYPVYLAAALVTLPWIGLGFDSTSLKTEIASVAKIFLLVFSNVFLVQAWFPVNFGLWNNGASWSISVELFCYLLLPVVLPILLKLRKKQILLVATFCYFLSVLPGITSQLFADPANAIFYTLPIYRFPEFLIGVCIHMVTRCGSEYRHGSIMQAKVWVLFFFYLGTFGGALHGYVGHNWIALPVIGFSIFSLSLDKGLISKILSISLFNWLGRISYGFYSFQALIILFLMSNHDHVLEKMPMLSNGPLLAVAAFLTLILISVASYFLIEEPSRRFITKRWGGSDENR